MKNFPIVYVMAILLALSSCQKSQNDEIAKQETKPETCLFGLTEFNLQKRAPLQDKKPQTPGGGGGGGTVTPPPPTGTLSTGVIFLDFDGHYVSGTSWNYAGDFSCAPANLGYDAINTITNRVASDYSPFNVIVTTSESVFNSVASNRRVRVVITESWEWYGQVGGVAYVNSFGSSSNTPCFVFSSLLSYNEKWIAESASHEAGHTLGLTHQAAYNGSTLVSSYNYGTGSGQTGWAPIMGCGYYQNLTTWHNGPTAAGYLNLQNDINIISGKINLIADDYSNTFTNAKQLSGTLSGILNASSDLDYFVVNNGAPTTINVTPFSAAAGNIGANLDIRLKIYNGSGQLISTINDPSILNASTTLNAGTYYIEVSSSANTYASTYGMLGRYDISVN